HRENSLRQINRRFALHVQWMRRHQAEQTSFRPDEYARHWPERNKSIKPKSAKSKSRRPQPSIKWVKYPSAVVIGQPSPRLRADKCRAVNRISEPTPASKRRPS